jgi:CubicO group peptidase (beta-lactamase class C family)
MKRTLSLLLFGVIISGLHGQTPAQEVNELLKQYAKQNSFNGVVLVAQKGKILLEQGFGYRDMINKTLMDTGTIFQIGSITKQFTAVIILQLLEENKLSLASKLSDYIPDYPKGDSITIENLLTHTSGIYNYTSDASYITDSSSVPSSLEDLIGRFKNKSQIFSPGSQYQYSNSGYILLGAVIEKITGKSYFTVIRERIFKPLGMIHSGFDFLNLKNRQKAKGYFKSTGKALQSAPIIDSTKSYAAGSIYTTAGDLYRWDRALYNNVLVHQETLEKAFTPYKANYGYGWVIDSSFGKKVVMHEGSTPGFVSFIARVPADQTCIILLDNKSSPGLAKIAENIDAILNQQPYDFPKPRKIITVDTALLSQYVGQYKMSDAFMINISLENGQLMLQASGQQSNELFAERENFFFMKLQDLQVEFLRDPGGQVDHLILYEFSKNFFANKIVKQP